MQEEKEKTKVRRNGEEEGGADKNDNQTPSADGKEIDEVKKKAQEAKDAAEKHRRRSRERMARVEKSEQQAGQKHRQGPGE